MAKYHIIVCQQFESVAQTTIEASTEDEAIEKAIEMCANGDLDFSDNEVIDGTMDVIECQLINPEESESAATEI